MSSSCRFIARFLLCSAFVSGALGFERFDYQNVPFDTDYADTFSRLEGIVPILCGIAANPDYPSAVRGQLVAAARRVDPLGREAFYTEYQLANDLPVTKALSLSKAEGEILLKDEIADLRRDSRLSTYLDFIEDTLFPGVQMSEDSFFPLSNDPFEPEPEAEPEKKETPLVIARMKYLSTQGAYLIGGASRPSGDEYFHYAPRALDSKTFRSGYREAVKYLGLSHAGALSGMKVDFDIEADLDSAEGPGANLSCAIITDALLNGYQVDSIVASCGDVNADGTVQPVWDLYTRLKATEDELPPVILIAPGDDYVVDDVLLLDGPKLFLDTQIIKVEKLSDAVSIASQKRAEKIRDALNLYASIQKVLASGDSKMLTNSHVQNRLNQVLEILPGHLSATQLKRVSEKKYPRRLSSYYSFDLVFGALRPLIEDGYEVNALGSVSESDLAALKKYQPRLDPSLAELAKAVIAFEQGGNLGSDRMIEKKRLAQRIKEELNQVSSDPVIREKIMR